MLKRNRAKLLGIVFAYSFNVLAFAGSTSWEDLTQAGWESATNGNLPMAERKLLAALEEAEKFDQTDPRLTESLQNLALLYEKLKQFDKAETLYSRELKLVEPLGDSYKDTLSILTALGRVSEARHNYRQAEHYFRRAQAINHNLPSKNDKGVNCRLLWGIGLNCDLQGKYAEAEPFLLETLTIKKKGTKAEPDMNRLYDEIASNFKGQRKFDQAENYARKAVTLKASQVGQNSPELIGYLLRLEYIDCEAGKLEKAEPISRQILRIARTSKSYGRNQTADRLLDLGNLCHLLKKYGEAESCYKEALAIYKRYDSNNYQALCRASFSLAEVYAAQQKFKIAQPLYESALLLKKKTLHPNDAETVRILDSEGVNLCKLNRTREAEHAYKKALVLQESLTQTKEDSFLVPLSFLADFYLSERRFTEAEPLYRKASALNANSSSPNDLMTAHVFHQLGATCAGLSRDLEAEDLYKQAIKVYDNLPSPIKGEQAACLMELANLYTRQKKYSAAENNYNRCLTILKDVPELREQYRMSIQCYADLLRKTKRNKEADRLLRTYSGADHS